MKVGGFAPNLDNEGALDVIVKAIQTVGYKAGIDIKIAMDCASGELYDKERKIYVFKKLSKKTGQAVEKTTDEMISYLEQLG